jgi:hypothetical protein
LHKDKPLVLYHADENERKKMIAACEKARAAHGFKNVNPITAYETKQQYDDALAGKPVKPTPGKPAPGEPEHGEPTPPDKTSKSHISRD